MKIAVVGGNGSVGKFFLIQALLERGHGLTVLARAPSKLVCGQG